MNIAFNWTIPDEMFPGYVKKKYWKGTDQYFAVLIQMS